MKFSNLVGKGIVVYIAASELTGNRMRVKEFPTPCRAPAGILDTPWTAVAGQ